ncbi:hypothetical protein Gasu_37230 isoform 1 [Galdieria sulphuraria]|uniref:Uncharacterized protein n=1 Tax=Galdieria sulphuraria TaxID=130081 RepID=M2XYY0_GALSU|nr:hypothetical protein Gasu_37230 isoform 1 [Galdieria sulphuraria]EME28833.1 hypothetical protein isoform 1 [Galdieria sulphuraria]|eukprot:XP_005705353.1 hypothetical protein isoform 1 [Galdieria sulphuraria]
MIQRKPIATQQSIVDSSQPQVSDSVHLLQVKKSGGECPLPRSSTKCYYGGGTPSFELLVPQQKQNKVRDVLLLREKRKKKRKPRGYWKDYSSVRKEIIQYVEQRDGVSGLDENSIALHRMPSANELRKSGRYALALAISSHHGGFHAVAREIGLQPNHHSSGYWDHFEHVAKEIAEWRTLYMPTYHQLLKARRLDLAKAIHKYGGFPAVAEKLGRIPNKRRKYWHNMDNLRNELLQFMQQNGLEQLPTMTLLSTCKRWDLMGAIRLHGGLYEVSRKTQIPLSKSTRQPRGYWSNIENLKEELTAFISFQDHSMNNIPYSIPTLSNLKRNQRQDLVEAIRKHGGVQTVAAKLYMLRQSKRKAKGYWNDFAILRAEISVFLRRYGTPGVMPLGHELRRHQRRDLCYAIQLHGGFSVVAGKLHLNWIGPISFWRNWSNLRKRLYADMEKWGYHRMPTLNDLVIRGRVDLAFGIRLHHGFPAVAKAFGLEWTIPSRPRMYWNDPENVITELKELIALLSNEEKRYMPSNETLYQLGRGDLADAIRDTKGWVYYAKRLGLVPHYRCISSHKLWKDVGFVRRQLQRYLSNRGLPLRAVASVEELYRDGRGDIAFAIMKYHQGATQLAHRLKWKAPHMRPLPPAYYRYWSNVIKQLVLWVDKYGTPGLMPSKKELFQTGYRDLVFVIYRHGGFQKVACRMGWTIHEDNPHWLTQWLASQAGYSMLQKPKRMKPFSKWMSFPDG